VGGNREEVPEVLGARNWANLATPKKEEKGGGIVDQSIYDSCGVEPSKGLILTKENKPIKGRGTRYRWACNSASETKKKADFRGKILRRITRGLKET